MTNMNLSSTVAATGLLVLLCSCSLGVEAFATVRTTATATATTSNTRSCAPLGSRSPPFDVEETTDAAKASATGTSDPLLIRAAKGQRTERAPVWMMRQAGRHIAEYRELCLQHPTFRQRSEVAEVAVEVSLQPWRNYRTDGCILFSDILTPLPGMGADFVIDDKVGPIMTTPIESYDGLKQVRLHMCVFVSKIERNPRALVCILVLSYFIVVFVCVCVCVCFIPDLFLLVF
jgi:hypothetical protein